MKKQNKIAQKQTCYAIQFRIFPFLTEVITTQNDCNFSNLTYFISKLLFSIDKTLFNKSLWFIVSWHGPQISGVL